jgi:hypothetical protein
MAAAGNVSSSQTSTVGIWAEVYTNINIPVTANTTNTFTLTLPINGSGSLFNPNLPIAVNCPTTSNIQGSQNNGLPSTIGIVSCVYTNASALTVTVANGGATANINTNTRLILQQANGI